MSNKNKNKVILGVSLAFLVANFANAANKISLNTNNTITKNNNATLINQLGDSYKFKQIRKVELPNGNVRYKFIQYYNDIPIWDSSVVSNREEIDDITNTDLIRGSLLINIEQDISSAKANLTESEAQEIAVKAAGVKDRSIVKHMNSTQYIKNYSDVAKTIYVVDFIIEKERVKSRPFFIIDASTGEILEKWEGLNTANYGKATGPGGNIKTGKYNYGKEYGNLIVDMNGTSCTMSSPNVDTYDMKHKTTGAGTLYKFTCPENTYKEINGGYSPINDAHYFGNVVYDMYKEWYKTAPLTFKLKMRVHYGNNYDNAMWDGQQMSFGDGGTTFHPLVSQDVVGHEVSHGFTQQNSNLVYEKQPGALNEAFSDIAGEASEYYFNINKTQGTKSDWLIGESIMKGAKGKALRYFADPTKDGSSIGHAKDYTDSLDVHQTSGVYNKAFYTLSNTANWDLKKAFDAFVLANQVYWTQNTGYDQGACGVKNAATDLGFEAKDVISAFKVVGVDASCGDDPTDPEEDPKDPTEPTPIPEAVELQKAVPVFGLSGNAGSKKLYYIDVTGSMIGVLSIWNFGGTGAPSMQVALNRVPTKSDYDCISNSEVELGNYRSCLIYSPKAGRYYITVNGDSSYRDVTLWGSFQ